MGFFNPSPKIPKSNDDCIILESLGNWGSEQLPGRKSNPFFKKGYPPQARFRSLITEKEWKRLNQEFVDVWNSFEATGPLPFLGVCCTYTGLGMFFLCIPCCWLSSLLEKRKKAVQVVVAKANKYIFRPRGMFMKERSILYSEPDYLSLSGDFSGGGPDTVSWYEIAMTPTEIDRLEKQKSHTTESGTCYCCGNPNKYVTDNTVEEDLEFKHRWPLPDMSLIGTEGEQSLVQSPGVMNVIIPNGTGPGQQIFVKCPNGEEMEYIIPPPSEWFFGDRPYFQIHFGSLPEARIVSVQSIVTPPPVSLDMKDRMGESQ